MMIRQHTMIKWGFFGCLLLWASGVQGQLSGGYTLNPAGAVSATNYHTLASFVSDLVDGTRADGGAANGPGVSAAVVLDVAAGTYAEQVTWAAVTGNSATNTITVQGVVGDSTAVVFAHPTGTGGNYVLQLAGVSHLTVQHLTLERTGTNTASRVIDFSGASNDVTIQHCQLLNGYSGTNGLSDVVFDNNAAPTLSNTVIRNNRIVGGRRSIQLVGGACCFTYSTGTVIEGNHLSGMELVGIWASFHDDLVIRGNHIECTSTSANSVGIELTRCPNSLQVAQNFIQGFARFGLYMTICEGTAANPGLIANNYINSGSSANSRYGIQVNNSNYQQLVHNTVNLSSCSVGTLASSSSACYLTGGGDHTLRNNLLVSSCGGYALSTNSTTNIASSDYNCLFTSGTNVGYLSAVRAALDDWQTASSGDANSLSQNPNFVTPANYPYTNTNLRGAGTAFPAVPTDINGVARPANPDIGCEQLPFADDDAGVANWVSPAFPRCPGLQDVEVTIRNFGDADLTSVTIAWEVDGVLQTPFSWTGSLAPATTSEAISIGSFAFDNTQQQDVRFWTELPNGNADGSAANDTLSALGTSFALVGSYTLGSGADFETFADAVDSLVTKGICEDVIINVLPGTYDAQFSLPEVPGAGPAADLGKTSGAGVNRVTFQSLGQDSSTVTLTTSAATFAENYVVQLDGADYITLAHLTIENATTLSNHNVVRLRGNAHHNVITNNELRLSTGSTESGTTVLLEAPGDSVNAIRFNRMLNNRWGIQYDGSAVTPNRQLEITGNHIETTQDGVNLRHINTVSISGNRLRRSTNFLPGASALNLFNINQGLTIAGNDIRYTTGTGTLRGINLLASEAAPTEACVEGEGQIHNNMILVGNSGTAEGVYMNASRNFRFYNNNIHSIGTNATSARAFYLNGPSSGDPASNANVVLHNNILSATVGRALYNSVGGIIDIDHNNYWVAAGTDIAYWISGNVADLAALQAANGQDGNSLSIDPLYASATDLTATNTDLEGAGSAVPCFNTDFNGEPHPALPSIGATEGDVPLSLEPLTLSAQVRSSHVQLAWGGSCVPSAQHTTLLRGTHPDSLQPHTQLPPARGLARQTYVDDTPRLGQLYYRADVTDDNGELHQSNVVQVLWTPTLSGWWDSNPILQGHPVGLQIQLPADAMLGWELLDMQGKRVAGQSERWYAAGRHHIALGAVSAKGVYLLRLQTDTQHLHKKLVVN